MATTRSGLRRSLRLGMDSAARRNPELSAARRATASGALRKRLTTLKATRPTGRFAPGPFNPNARIGPNTSVVRDPGIKANAVPRPGDLRSAAVSLARGQVPQGSLLGNIVGTLGRALSGGRAGVPRNVSPVSPPALQSITPNMVNQSEVGSVLRGVIRRRLGTRTMTTAQRPRSRAGSARTM